MKLLRKAMKYGLVAKGIDEAKKPENQRRAKNLVQKMVAKRQGRQQPTHR